MTPLHLGCGQQLAYETYEHGEMAALLTIYTTPVLFMLYATVIMAGLELVFGRRGGHCCSVVYILVKFVTKR